MGISRKVALLLIPFLSGINRVLDVHAESPPPNSLSVESSHEGDASPECGAWADLGECESNAEYMLSHCADSCWQQSIIQQAVGTGIPFPVYCNTTVGMITYEMHPAWAPWGVERFVKLLADGFFDGTPFFRAIPKFLVQFGVSLDEEVKQRWDNRPSIPDDKQEDKPLTVGFKKGMMAFAGNGEHSRTTQLFVAFEDNELLGEEPWETPVGVVVDGMSRLETIAMYGDFPDFGGSGPDPEELEQPGARNYLKQHFNQMDYILSCHAELPIGEEE
jgi:peptidyl-prolyl cis-trans isomerase A (cyclophilin A)